MTHACVTWLIHMRHDSFIWDMIHSNEIYTRLDIMYLNYLPRRWNGWVVSDMNGSCHIWMSHVTYEWVMSDMNGSCHVRMRHDTCEWVMPHGIESWHTCNESCHIWMGHVTYEWVISHTQESCHIWVVHVIYEWVVSHYHIVTYEWVISALHTWMRHVTYMTI